VTSEGHPEARLRRALAVRNLTAAEQAAFEVAFVQLAQARALVELYAEHGDPKVRPCSAQVSRPPPDRGEADARRRRPDGRASGRARLLDARLV